MQKTKTSARPSLGATPVKGNDKVVILLSGGMDSTTLLYYMRNVGKEVYPITFSYGQKHTLEVGAAKFTCIKLGLPHKVLDLRALGEIAPSALTREGVDIPEGHYEAEGMKATVVPNRNMVFLALATAYAIGIDAEEVAYAAHSGDHAIYPDCRPGFIRAVKEAVRLCNDSEIYLSTPFEDLHKEDILRMGLELGVDYSLTWSCYKGGNKSCGKCGTCIERLEAFERIGKGDPLEYED